jgi:glycosyltransferase involved in cell wall biosynthesis
VRIRPQPSGRRPAETPQQPKVGVAIYTYNHEQFIAEALESVLDQEASFNWEIVVGDDASTDGTREILRSYAEAYPGRIRLLLHPESLGPNERNLDGKNNFLATYRACGGEYVALLEGDDYWTDNRKLAKQVEFLETHPTCSFCCHPVAIEYSGDRKQHWDRIIGESDKESATLEDVLRLETKPEMPTPSMMIRRSSLSSFPGWFSGMFNGDYAMQVLLAQRGDVGFLPDCMAVHRKHDRGLSRVYDTDPVFINAMLLKLHLALNEHLGYRYSAILGSYIEREQQIADAAALTSVSLEHVRSRETVLALEDFAPAHGRVIHEPDGAITIETASTPWSYGARIALPTKARTRPAGDAGLVRVRARADRAAVGIGVVDRGGERFLDRRSIEPGGGDCEVRLGIPNLREACELIVQTWSEAKSGTLRVESIGLVVLLEPPVGAVSR